MDGGDFGIRGQSVLCIEFGGRFGEFGERSKINKLKKRAKMKAKKRNVSSQLVVSLLPLPTPHIPITFTRPPQHSQHKPDGEDSDVFCQHVGGVRDPNPLLLVLREVDLVHSDAEARHNLQP